MYLIAWKTVDGRREWKRVSDTQLASEVERLRTGTDITAVYVFDIADRIDESEIDKQAV